MEDSVGCMEKCHVIFRVGKDPHAYRAPLHVLRNYFITYPQIKREKVNRKFGENHLLSKSSQIHVGRCLFRPEPVGSNWDHDLQHIWKTSVCEELPKNVFTIRFEVFYVPILPYWTYKLEKNREETSTCFRLPEFLVWLSDFSFDF